LAQLDWSIFDEFPKITEFVNIKRLLLGSFYVGDRMDSKNEKKINPWK